MTYLDPKIIKNLQDQMDNQQEFISNEIKSLAELIIGQNYNPNQLSQAYKTAGVNTQAQSYITSALKSLSKQAGQMAKDGQHINSPLTAKTLSYIIQDAVDLTATAAINKQYNNGQQSRLIRKNYTPFYNDQGTIVRGGQTVAISDKNLTQMTYVGLDGKSHKVGDSFSSSAKAYQEISDRITKLTTQKRAVSGYNTTDSQKAIQGFDAEISALHTKLDNIMTAWTTAVNRTTDTELIDNVFGKKASYEQAEKFYGDFASRLAAKFPQLDTSGEYEYVKRHAAIERNKSQADLNKEIDIENQKQIKHWREQQAAHMKAFQGLIEGQKSSSGINYKETFNSLKQLTDGIISGSIDFEQGKELLALLNSQFRDGLGLTSHSDPNVTTTSIQGMGGNDIGYNRSGKVVSTGYRDVDDFDPNDYELQQRMAENGHEVVEETVANATDIQSQIYTSFNDAVLSTLELRRAELKAEAKKQADNFYGRPATEAEMQSEYDKVDTTVNKVANMANAVTNIKGRDFSSILEQVDEDANALANLFGYSKGYEAFINPLAKQKGMTTSQYMTAYPLGEAESLKLDDSYALRDIVEESLVAGKSMEETIDSMVSAFDSKEMHRIAKTWREAKVNREDTIMTVKDKDGNVIPQTIQSPFNRFIELFTNQITQGAKSLNPVNKEYINNHPYLLSQEEHDQLSPAERRSLSRFREKDWNPNSTAWYSGEDKPMNIGEMQRQAEQQQAQALSEKVAAQKIAALNQKQWTEEEKIEARQKRDLKRYEDLKTKYGINNRGYITWNKQKGFLSEEEIAADKAFATQFRKNLALQKTSIQEQPPIVTEPTQPPITQPDNINQLGDISSLITVLGQFVQAVEQSTAALTAHTSATKTDTEVEQVAAIAEEQIVNKSKVTLEKLDIRQSDNFAQDHTYYDADGNRVMSATQLRDTLLGKHNPTLAKDIQTVKNMASQLGDGEILTADMVGAKVGDFNFLKNIIGSGLKGDIFHEITDGIFKWNASHSNDMISSLEELKGRDDSTYNALTNKFNKTRTELAKYGYGDDYLTTHSDIAAYMQAIQKMGLTPTGFSEKALGFTLSGAQGAFKVAVTPDQLYSGALGPVLMDNKTGAVKGFESFQLMAQLLGLKANAGTMSELEGLDLDKTELTIADVKNGFAQILKYSELTKEQFYDLLVRAQGILDGTAAPLDQSEVMALSTQQKTGIVTGGEQKPYVNPQEQNQWIREYTGQQKQYNKTLEQIDLLTRKSNDPSRTAVEKQSYAEQITLLQQKLALLQQSHLMLTKEGALVRVVNGEEGKQLQLGKEQLAQLEQEMALLNKQHQTNMAKNAGYVNKDQRGFFGAVFGQIKQTFQYLTRTTLVYGVIGKIQQTFQTLMTTVKTLDKAMVDLQIATNTTRDELQKATKDYNGIAREMGRTTQEVMSAANDWLRAGYQTEEANSLIQNSMKLSTLGMIDSAKATEYLISTMKGWKLSVEEVNQVVDEMTALDAKAALTAGDLATAMAKANVSASLAGVNRQSYEAMLTTVIDTSQQSADSIGTAFKTLFARYGNVKAGKYASSYDSEDTDGEFTALNDIETVLGEVDIKTRNTVGEFRNMEEVLEEIASKWYSIDEVSQNAITTAMAGKIVARTYSNVWLSGI